jgi:DNA polymerase III subunit gamma/tau
MSYLVLARKYRPRTFSEMVGQAHVVQALSNALTSKRLHHAYLFTGTRGVGKTTVSRILAKSLNCQGPDGLGDITSNPCGVCQACTDIDSGRFVDYTELDAASNRSVDEVQTLLEQAAYKPVQGRFKVFMIDEVHMLTGHAFNAMLKTLEEPPEYLKFVLATTDPQKVPVTVLSRCLQFNLRPMAPETIAEHLALVLQQENVTFEPAALRALARSARGSMRDALSLTDQAIAFGSGQLSDATVRHMLGSVDTSHVFGLIDALARADGKAVVDAVSKLRTLGLSAATTLEEMTVALQSMAVMQLAGPLDDSPEPEARELARLAALMPADETQLLYSMALHGRAELGLAPDEYAALTMVLLRLLAFKPPGSAAATTEVVEKKSLNPATLDNAAAVALPTKPEPVAQPLSVPKPSSASAPGVQAPSPPPGVRLAVSSGLPQKAEPLDQPAANEVLGVAVRIQTETRADTAAGLAAPLSLLPTEEGNFWHLTVTSLIASEAVTALVRELALQSQLVARDTGAWLLRVERETLNQPQARERLQTALLTLGHTVVLAVEIGRVTDSPARRMAAAAANKQLAAEKIIFDDPFVQTMMRDFGAKIVPGSIKAT